MSKALDEMLALAPKGSYVVSFRRVAGFTAFGRGVGDVSVSGGLCDWRRKSVVMK